MKGHALERNEGLATVTVHSCQAAREPSDTVTFTVCMPKAPAVKVNTFVLPPTTEPSVRHV